MTFHERLLEFDHVRELVSSRCVSDLGKRRVAGISPMTDHAVLRESIILVREMMKLIADRKDPPIHGLRDCAAHLKKVAREKSVLEPLELLELRDFCDTSARMRGFFQYLEADYPSLHALAMPLHGVPGLIRSIEEKIAPNGQVRDNASERLQQVRSAILATEQTIQRELTRMVRQFVDSGDLQEDFFTLRNDRYVLPVKSSNRGKVKGIIHDSSNTGETVFIEPFEVMEQANKLAELRVTEREEVYRILLRVAGHVRDELNVLLTNQEIMGEFDLVYAKSRFGTAFRCSFPQLTGSDVPMNLVDVHHPLLFAANPEISRPLNLALDAIDRVLIITGPNAGGKTTALKIFGLTAIMVQAAIPAPLSDRSRMPIFTNVLADIGDEQDVLQGFSTFSAHMKRMVEILDTADGASLVLLDELGTATDPGEGGALAVSILESLAERGAITIVSTHLGVLKNWAHGYAHGRNASFRLSEREHRPTFRLSLDIPGISEALVIAEQVGLPAEIISRARGLRPQQEHDATALLVSLQQKEQHLVDQIEENERLRVDLETERDRVRDAEARLREDKRKYREKMLKEKDDAVRALREQVEAVIAHQPSKQELAAVRRQLEMEEAQLEVERQRAKRSTGEIPLSELKPGMRVYVVSLNEEGRVVELLEKRGDVRVALRRLTATVPASDLKRPKLDQADDGEGMVRYRKPSDMPMSIDLHGNRVDEALPRVEKFLDDALTAGLGWVRLVHGHGSGALRRAIHEYLKTYPHVKSFRHGAPNEGGGSVTIVEFR